MSINVDISATSRPTQLRPSICLHIACRTDLVESPRSEAMAGEEKQPLLGCSSLGRQLQTVDQKTEREREREREREMDAQTDRQTGPDDID